MSPAMAVIVLIAVWLLASALGAAALALLARRIHPSLNYRRLWLVYFALLAFMVAAIMAIAWW